MPQTTVILTQTSLDKSKLNKLIAAGFFSGQGLDGYLKKTTKIDEQLLDNIWGEKNTSGQIINLDIQDLDDYRKKTAILYERHSEATLVIFGDIRALDQSVQQAALKLFEEVPANLSIIINCQSVTDLLPTIKSRSTVIQLPKPLVLQLLDQDLSSKVKQKLPSPVEFAKNMITKELSQIALPDPKDVEREELDFWFWQLQIYLEEYYKQKPIDKISTQIYNLLQSKKMNNQNLQKKLVLASLKQNI